MTTTRRHNTPPTQKKKQSVRRGRTRGARGALCASAQPRRQRRAHAHAAARRRLKYGLRAVPAHAHGEVSARRGNCSAMAAAGCRFASLWYARARAGVCVPRAAGGAVAQLQGGRAGGGGDASWDGDGRAERHRSGSTSGPTKTRCTQRCAGGTGETHARACPRRVYPAHAPRVYPAGTPAGQPQGTERRQAQRYDRAAFCPNNLRCARRRLGRRGRSFAPRPRRRWPHRRSPPVWLAVGRMIGAAPPPAPVGTGIGPLRKWNHAEHETARRLAGALLPRQRKPWHKQRCVCPRPTCAPHRARAHDVHLRPAAPRVGSDCNARLTLSCSHTSAPELRVLRLGARRGRLDVPASASRAPQLCRYY